FIVRCTEHSDEVDLLGQQSRRLKRRRSLLDPDGFEIKIVDSCKGRQQKPLRLSRADRPRLSLEVFERLNVRVLAPKNRDRYVTQLSNRDDGRSSGPADYGGRNIGEAYISPTRSNGADRIRRTRAGLDGDIQSPLCVKAFL